MEPSTLERALHMWPEWAKSIHKARERYSFTPGRPLGPDNWDWKWQLENQQQVYRFAVSELDRLELPRALAWYWQCCFYVDYERPDGSVDYDAIVDWLGIGVKVYPSLWHIEYYSPNDAAGTMRIETNIRLLSKRTLAQLAAEMMSYQRPEQQLLHPLVDFIHRAKASPERKKQTAIARFQAGEVAFPDLLREQFADGDVQARLAEYRRRYANNARRLDDAIKGLRKEVYDRVYGWFYSAGIKPPRIKKGEW